MPDLYGEGEKRGGNRLRSFRAVKTVANVPPPSLYSIGYFFRQVVSQKRRRGPD